MNQEQQRIILIAAVVTALIAAGPTHAAPSPISLGASHACAVDSRGNAVCWGDNTAGQLGNGTVGALMRYEVAGLDGAPVIAAGTSHTCAITLSRRVKCWGINNNGQLGNGAVLIGLTPVEVTGLSDVSDLALGGSFSCALTGSGTIKCWGANAGGQLGNDSTTDSTVPVDVQGLSGRVAAIATGESHACALMASGGVQCWGANLNGQLGDGTTLMRTKPVDVSALGGSVKKLAAGGNHTCAILEAGPVRCWGRNANGELGDGSTNDSHLPVDVHGLDISVVDLALPSSATCARTAGSGVKCWGRGSLLGLFYHLDDSPLPLDAALPGGVERIYAGPDEVCAIAGGSASCWGSNESGQLGNNFVDTGLPTAVVGIVETISSVAIGRVHACALLSTGGIKCWGNARDGVLGSDAAAFYNVAAPVPGLQGTTRQIAAGEHHTCALRASGGVTCWGSNENGELGDGTMTDRGVPGDVSGLTSGVQEIAVGGILTCALKTTGGVQCWGTLAGHKPTAIPNVQGGVASIGAGRLHACAIMTDTGGVRCWGQNETGALGNGSVFAGGILEAVDVVGLSERVVEVVGGSGHTCARTASGDVKCWGKNGQGQLGNGTTTNSSVPVSVAGLPGPVKSIAAIQEGSCAVTVDGALWCWGGYLTPVVPSVRPGFAGGVLAASLGADFVCAEFQGGGVSCYGSNQDGQLGEGTRIFQRYSAQSVVGVGGRAFLDLTPDDPIDDTRASSILTVTKQTGTDVKVDVQFGRNAGKTGGVYVFAIVPASALRKSRAAKAAPAGPPMSGGTTDGPGGCVLAQPDPSTGELRQASAQSLAPYVNGVLSTQGQSVNVLNSVIAAQAPGGTFFVGDGVTSGTMLTDGTNRSVASVGTPQCAAPDSLTGSYEGLWLKGDEGGWGVNITHQGTTLFATWFTYDTDGSGMWLVASGVAQTSAKNFSGTLYRTAGPAFGANPFDSIGPANYTTVGTLSFSFTDANTGTMSYTVNEVMQSKAIARYIYASGGTSCILGAPPGTSANYQDLWIHSPLGTESGWGVNIAHQGDILFATWFTYLAGGGSNNKGMWLVMSNGNKTAPGVYTGALQTTTGPAFSAVPFNPTSVVRSTVGSATFSFTDANNGTFNYTVNGVTQSKPIARYLYASPTTVCQ